jgi:maleate cis-trans isomerase
MKALSAKHFILNWIGGVEERISSVVYSSLEASMWHCIESAVLKAQSRRNLGTLLMLLMLL